MSFFLSSSSHGILILENWSILLTGLIRLPQSNKNILFQLLMSSAWHCQILQFAWTKIFIVRRQFFLTGHVRPSCAMSKSDTFPLFSNLNGSKSDYFWAPPRLKVDVGFNHFGAVSIVVARTDVSVAPSGNSTKHFTHCFTIKGPVHFYDL